MSDNDEKRPPPADISDDERESAAVVEDDGEEFIDDTNEKSKLLSSRDTSPSPSDDDEPDEEQQYARFDRPTPSRSKRFVLLVFLALLFWLGFQMRRSLLEGKKSKVIYASRCVLDSSFPFHKCTD